MLGMLCAYAVMYGIARGMRGGDPYSSLFDVICYKGYTLTLYPS